MTIFSNVLLALSFFDGISYEALPEKAAITAPENTISLCKQEEIAKDMEKAGRRVFQR